MQRAILSDISNFTKEPDEFEKYQDMYEAGLKLPQKARAMIASEYYKRAHLNQLGLRLIATCDTHIIEQVFGSGAEAVLMQCRKYENDN